MTIPLIRLENICKSYRGVAALDGVCLDVERGSILAFMGPNGAGKTTAIKIMTGLLRPDRGRVYYNGKPFNPRSSEQKRLMGVVPQHNNIDRDLSVEENLRVHGMLFGLYGRVLGAKMDEVLHAVDLAPMKAQVSGRLSGGLQRRLTIARALLHDPQILFLDEPSNGLDPTNRRAIHGLVRRLNREAGVTVFLTTHAIDEAEALSTRVAFITGGRLAATGHSLEMKAAIGRFALDVMDGSGEFSLAHTRYFSLRAEAVKAAQLATANVNIREVTLEDVYARATGKRLTGTSETAENTERRRG
jgi:ABC-type multidrug transport system, ATPase component